jgi:hypothetical protein
MVAKSKIDCLKAWSKEFKSLMDPEDSILRDVMIYLGDHVLLEKNMKAFRTQLEELVVCLVDEYLK